MKPKRIIIRVRSIFFAAIIGITGCKQASKEQTKEPVVPKFKMTTELPAGIASPDEVETRIGTLKFFDGFPDSASAEKLYANLDFQRAMQAYLLALPPVSMVGLREGLTKYGPANITIPTFENLMDSRSLFLTANANTPYTWMWINLKDGPLVAEIPANVLGMINDFWFYYNATARALTFRMRQKENYFYEKSAWRQREQLGTNNSRKGMEHTSQTIWSTSTLV